MLHICPQLSVRFLIDSNNWNLKATPNLRTVKQMPRQPSQLASDSVLADRGVTRLDGAGGKKQVWRPHVRT